MSTPIHDVVIVGGGPAGLYAAGQLADAGLDVVVLEEHEAWGQPVHCTGLVAAEAFVRFALPPNVILNEVQTAQFFSPSNQTVALSSAKVEAVVVDRNLFDGAVAERAEASGARLVHGERVRRIEVEQHRIHVLTGTGNVVHGRCCVLACGANYRFHRELGLGLPSVFLQSAQVEVPAKTIGDVELHFGTHVAPKGFGWAVPVIRGGRTFARIGLMCDRMVALFFQSFLERIAPRWGLSGVEELVPRRKMLPLAPIGKTFSNRVLAIGDAAGLVKPTTGGGIYYSLVSAALAGDVLIEALRSDCLDEGSLSQYESEWRRGLKSEIESQLQFRLLVQDLDDSQIDDLFDLAKTNGLMPLVCRTARFNQHRELIVAILRHKEVRDVFFRRMLA
jgi:geranylgeranyl reductase family protein